MHDDSLRLMTIAAESDDRLFESARSSSVDFLSVKGALHRTSVKPLRVLGHGRAAEARLVQVTDTNRQTSLCVEKVFRPGYLTRLIYRIAFQAPFAYQHNADAIQATFYRRRAAAAIVETMLPEAKVAQPLYVRWDHQAQALVLASEYIRGRGIVPAPVDSNMIRRWFASLFRKSSSVSMAPAEEIHELLDLMTRLEALLIQCGLTGSGWQVCKRAMVSTANLLRTDSGYVVVDLESGIPSVLVPAYIIQGLRMQSLPPFDDLDAGRLRSWLSNHRDQLSASLGAVKHEQLQEDIDNLILHTDNWKRSEPALGRQPRRLLTADFLHRFRTQTLDRWQRCEIVDVQTAGQLSNSRRFFTKSIFLFGLIPGRTGRFAQRLWANRQYRQQVRLFLTDAQFRAQKLTDFAKVKSTKWTADARIASESCYKNVTPGFIANWMLSKVTPAAVQRWLVDRQYRNTQLTQMLLLCVSGRFQSEYGRCLIRSRIEHWRMNVRLSAQEAGSLNQQLESTAVDEYVRGFGLHIGLKLLLPVVMSLKIGGAAASVASGNPFYFLFMLMLVPMLRTAVTLWRMTANRRSPAEFRHALLVGMLPVVGSLAYPVQMYARFSGLSMFLLRDFASRAGCWFPVYGGKDSRIELLAIKSANIVAEIIEVWLAATRLSNSTQTAGSDLSSRTDSLNTVTAGRWDRLVTEQLARMSQPSLSMQTINIDESQSDLNAECVSPADAAGTGRRAA